MKKLIIICALICTAVLPKPVRAETIAEEMGHYCSAPPYVTRNVAPNIMIIMDNSLDMRTAAHTGSYNAATTYAGYYEPTACYAYKSNRFIEMWQSGRTSDQTQSGDTSYTVSQACPSTAPFRGNLLNWATTSKYDLLQKVLLGGKATSTQANTNRIIGVAGLWTKKYNGCQFTVSGNGFTVSDDTSGTPSTCALLDDQPIAEWEPITAKGFLAWLKEGVHRAYASLCGDARALVAACCNAWRELRGNATAFAAPSQTHAISPSGSPMTIESSSNLVFNATCSGSGCGNPTYYWTFSYPDGQPTWLGNPVISGPKQTTATLTGTPPTTATNFRVTANVALSSGGTVVATTTYSVTLKTIPLEIITTGLSSGQVGAAYSSQVSAQGGIPAYTWSAAVAGYSNGLSDIGLSIDSGTGLISGSPTASGPFDVTVTVRDSNGATDSRTFSLSIAASGGGRSKNYTNILDIYAETFANDVNGNQIFDEAVCDDSGTPCETLSAANDKNGDTEWQGKEGLVQKYWDDRTNHIKARWGVTDFDNSLSPKQEACIPATTNSSLYNAIQNAIGQDANGNLSDALFSAISLYKQTGANYNNNCGDPIDAVPCRKNFVLIITSGANVTGANFSGDCTSTLPANLKTYSSYSLVQNACYGYKTDLRTTADKPGKQNVYTYVVNTGAYSGILEAAAKAGGGTYYDAENPSALENKLAQAFTDILAQAASGTAVSVLTTSSRGIGSMVQAYFLPSKQDQDQGREVRWIGYTQNLWIDPQDNLREDTGNSDGQIHLKLDQDNVLKLFFDTTTNETKAALFTTNADGSGGNLATCGGESTPPSIIPFNDVKYVWEAGKKLTSKSHGDREIFTSTKVIRGTDTPRTFANSPTKNYPLFNTSMDATNLKPFLNGDATIYTADNIIDYIRGDDIEATNNNFRDRRLTVDGTVTVWKLGDIISSTPKVFANTPVNTYHTDYGDTSYYKYITSDAYRQTASGERASVAFVGANDGMLHAFRVGYLKDKKEGNVELLTGVKALFKDFFSAADNVKDRLGEEIWGYIPFNAFPYLKYLAVPSYCHLYFNDLSVRLVDASLGLSMATNPGPDAVRAANGDSWNTILIGGMRFGAAGGTPGLPAGVSGVGFSSYYAMDITDPLHPKPLWEFSDVDMGYATTFPAVIRTGDKDKNGNWYVVIGSGSKILPKSGTFSRDIGRDSTGYLYILDLKTGVLVKKIDLGHYAIVGDILAVDKDKDYHSEAVYFGTSYQSTGWKGKLMSLAIPANVKTICGSGESEVSVANSDCVTGSTLRTLFSGSYPITASPDAAKDVDGDVWVFAGSGKYYSDQDETDSGLQILLGLKDKTDGSITYPLKTDIGGGLVDTTLIDTKGEVKLTEKTCGYDSTNNKFDKLEMVTTIIPSTTATAALKGWFVTLSAREKVISRPMAVGGLVDFLTYVPSSDPCSYGGDSYLYALGYTTGVAPTNLAIRAPGSTSAVSGTNVTVYKGVRLGPGAPPTGEAIIIPPPKEGQETLKKKIQIATGVIVESENKPVFSVISKIVHWLKK